MTLLDGPTNGTDVKATRIRVTTDAKIATEDARVEREIRLRSAETNRKLQAESVQLEIERKRRENEASRKAAAKKARQTRRTHRTAARRAFVNRLSTYVRTNMVAVYCGAIYGAAVAVAVIGQISMAASRGWPLWVGILIALFVEGIALSMALTGHEMRLQGERAVAPRVLTWVVALLAASINYAAHSGDPVLAVVYAAGSLAGITVWEVRSAAKHRTQLRRKQLIPDPPVRFGVRRWLRYPRSTFRAWSLDIRDRAGKRAAWLLAQSTKPSTRQRRKEDRHRRRLELKAAKTGTLLTTVTVILAGDGSFEDPWQVPASISNAGLRAVRNTDQTGPVGSDQTTPGPSPVAVPGPTTTSGLVRSESDRSANGPAHPVRAIRQRTEFRSDHRSEGGPKQAMTEAFNTAVTEGVLPSHFSIRDRAKTALGVDVIDVSFAKRLHQKLCDELPAEVLAKLRNEAS